MFCGWKAILIAFTMIGMSLSCARSDSRSRQKSPVILPSRPQASSAEAAPKPEPVAELAPKQEALASSRVAKHATTGPVALSSAETESRRPVVLPRSSSAKSLPAPAAPKPGAESQLVTLDVGAAFAEADRSPAVAQAARSGMAARLPTGPTAAGSAEPDVRDDEVVIGTVEAMVGSSESTAHGVFVATGGLERRVRKHWGSPIANTALICLGVIHLLWGCRIGRQGTMGDCIIFGLILGVARIGLPAGVLLAIWLSIVAWFFPRHAIIVLAVLVASYMTWIGLWVVPGGPGTYGATIVAAIAMIVGFVFMVRLGVMDLHGATAAAGSFLGSSLILAGVMQCSETLTQLMLDVVFYLPLMVVALTALGLFYQLTAPRVDEPEGPVAMPRT